MRQKLALTSGLFDTESVSDYPVAEEHTAAGSPARSDLAAVMLAQIDDERYLRKILAIAATENLPSMRQPVLREAFG